MVLTCSKCHNFCPLYKWTDLDSETCKKLDRYMNDYDVDMRDRDSADPSKHLDHYWAKLHFGGDYIFVLTFDNVSYTHHMEKIKTYEDAIKQYDLILEAMDKMAEKLEALVHEEVE